MKATDLLDNRIGYISINMSIINIHEQVIKIEIACREEKLHVLIFAVMEIGEDDDHKTEAIELELRYFENDWHTYM